MKGLPFHLLLAYRYPPVRSSATSGQQNLSIFDYTKQLSEEKRIEGKFDFG